MSTNDTAALQTAATDRRRTDPVDGLECSAKVEAIVTDGGTETVDLSQVHGEAPTKTDADPSVVGYTRHVEPREQGGEPYFRCEGCDREILASTGLERLIHTDGVLGCSSRNRCGSHRGERAMTDVYADQLVEQTETGVSITSKVTRGTGKRNQDIHTIKAQGHTLTGAIAKHKGAMKYLEKEVVDGARELQPGDGESEVDQ